MSEAKRALPTLFEPMSYAHSSETAGDRHQCDGLTDPHSSVIVRNVDERLHISPRVPAPICPPSRLLPLSLPRKPFPCPSTVRGCRFPFHSNGRPISDRRRCLIIPCRRRFVLPRLQKIPVQTESDFIPINVVGIKRHRVFRPFIWEAIMTAHGEGAGRDHY